jgi:putative PIG3 family NAD(P)H quinone oxidoreductase
MVSPLPRTLTAIIIEKPAGPEVLVAAERAMPAPLAGQVLIEVAAAGINRPDILQRQGLYAAPPGAPDWPGLEVAGTVIAIGTAVTAPKIGERVMALVAGGGYATHAIADASLALPVPDTLSDIEAAGVPETFFTVWVNVFMRARLLAGESFLVHGGASGIGTTAIQLAKLFGARVFTTAGTPEKVAACAKLGADVAINYKTQDFVEVVKSETGGRGVDVILDMVGAPYIPKNIEILADQGRHASIAFLKGAKAEINFFDVMRKRLTLTGSTLRPRTLEEKTAIAEELRTHVLPLLAARRVVPVIDSIFPLARAADAHAKMEADTHIGKIILTV